MHRHWFFKGWILFSFLFFLSPAVAERKKRPKIQERPTAFEAVADEEMETASGPVLVTPAFPSVRHEILVSGLRMNLIRSKDTFRGAASLGYQFTLLNNQIQAGFLGALDYVAAGQEVPVTVTSLLGGLTFNFPEGQDLRYAYFLSVFAGATGGNAPDIASLQFEMLALVGKRFALSHWISYRPQLGLEFYGTDVLFQANLLSFSVLL